MSHGSNLPIKTIAGRAGLVAHVQPPGSLLQLAQEALHRCRRRIDLADIANLAVPAAFSNGHRILVLRNIDADEDGAVVLHGLPSFA